MQSMYSVRELKPIILVTASSLIFLTSFSCSYCMGSRDLFIASSSIRCLFNFLMSTELDVTQGNPEVSQWKQQKGPPGGEIAEVYAREEKIHNSIIIFFNFYYWADASCLLYKNRPCGACEGSNKDVWVGSNQHFDWRKRMWGGPPWSLKRLCSGSWDLHRQKPTCNWECIIGS